MTLESIYTISNIASFDIEERVEVCMQNLVDEFNKNIRKNLVVDRNPEWCSGGSSFLFKQGDNSYCASNSDLSLPCSPQFNSCRNLVNGCCTSGNKCGLGE